MTKTLTKQMNLQQRAESLGLKSSVSICWRYHNGWDFSEAISITKEEAKKRADLKKRTLFHKGRYIGEFVKPENLQITRLRILKGMHPQMAIENQDIRFHKVWVKPLWEKSKKIVSCRRVQQRLYHGWGIEEALNTPLIKSRWERNLKNYNKDIK